MAPKPWKSPYVHKKPGKIENPRKERKTRKLTYYTHSILKLGPRAFLRGLWVTRCVYEALQALTMALWASLAWDVEKWLPDGDFLVIFFSHQKNLTNGFKDVSARFRTTLAFFGSSLGGVLRQNVCKINDFEPKPLHNSTNIGSLELKTKYQKMLQKRSKVLQNDLIRRPRAFSKGGRGPRS